MIALTAHPWRQLLKEAPPYSTVQNYLYAWSREGVFAGVNQTLVMVARDGPMLRIHLEMAGREASPTAGVIDSQSAQTMEVGGPRGL